MSFRPQGEILSVGRLQQKDFSAEFILSKAKDLNDRLLRLLARASKLYRRRPGGHDAGKMPALRFAHKRRNNLRNGLVRSIISSMFRRMNKIRFLLLCHRALALGLLPEVQDTSIRRKN